MARPSTYTPEIADIICERIADGQSVREISRDENMPSKATIFRWLSAHDDFQKQYAYAKEAQAEHLADEMLDISDDGANDWIERRGSEGEIIGYRENGEAVNRSRLRIDTRKWLLGKLKPKKYGDKTTLAGDADNPIAITEVVRRVVRPDNRDA